MNSALIAVIIHHLIDIEIQILSHHLDGNYIRVHEIMKDNNPVSLRT